MPVLAFNDMLKLHLLECEAMYVLTLQTSTCYGLAPAYIVNVQLATSDDMAG